MTALAVPQHPILEAIASLGRALDEVTESQAVYLSTAEKAQALRALAVLESRVTGLRLRVMAAADDVAEQTGARDVAAWFSHHALSDPEVARADQRLARRLDQDRADVAGALAAGRCSVDQAQVIVRALEDLPARVGRDVIDLAESTLVGYAEHFGPRELRRLGRHVLDVVAPEIAEAQEGRRLAEEERHARAKKRQTVGAGVALQSPYRLMKRPGREDAPNGIGPVVSPSPVPCRETKDLADSSGFPPLLSFDRTAPVGRR